MDELITDAEQLLVALDSLRTKALLGGLGACDAEDAQRKLDLEAQVAEIHERMTRLKMGKADQSKSELKPKNFQKRAGTGASTSKRCTLTCISPDRSPFQGR